MFEADGLVSNANYNGKKTTFLLFINHRSVESTAIKRAIEQTYSSFLPKGGKAFVYLSLTIDPIRVDVNVHPTKREVAFLNEDEIVDVVCEEIRRGLGKVDTSRSFLTQSVLSGGKTPSISKSYSIPEESPSNATSGQRPATVRPSAGKVYENNLIRTDAKARKITSMLQKAQSTSSANDEPIHGVVNYEYTDRDPTICRLTTIKELRLAVREDIHGELTETIANHTFVGVVDDDKRIAAIQGGVKLFLVDYGILSAEFFYQLGLTDFGNFGAIRLDPPLNLRELLAIGSEQMRGLEPESSGLDWPEIIDTVANHLLSRSDMLSEYFNMEISSEGDLLSIPLLLKDYMPCLAKLPTFLLRLGPHVDWKDEKACFQTFLRELASFYIPESLPPVGDKALDGELENRRTVVHGALENVLFPAFKSRLVATNGLSKGMVEVANLKGLYRVFERC